MPEHPRIFALLTEQGTACAETGLCDEHDSTKNREQTYEGARDQRNVAEKDLPIKGSWTDCGANEAIECQVCGRGTTIDSIPQAVALVGNLADGFRAFGPYESFDAAANAHDGEESWIVTLEPARQP